MHDVRLIDANALLEEIDEEIEVCQPETTPSNKFISIGLKTARKDINRMPTVDAQPIIHAHWIMLDKQVGQCSNCGYCQKSNGIDKTGHGNIHKLVYKWCAVCGAKMEEKHEENSNSV